MRSLHCEGFLKSSKLAFDPPLPHHFAARLTRRERDGFRTLSLFLFHFPSSRLLHDIMHVAPESTLSRIEEREKSKATAKEKRPHRLGLRRRKPCPIERVESYSRSKLEDSSPCSILRQQRDEQSPSKHSHDRMLLPRCPLQSPRSLLTLDTQTMDQQDPQSYRHVAYGFLLWAA